MGFDNVKLCYARWTHVPDPGFRLLVFMALSSMDADDPPLFWASREEMAFALNRRMPAEPAPGDLSPRAQDDRNQREADAKAVQRALAQIIKTGAAALHQAPAPGRRATFRLLLGAPRGYGTVDVPRPQRWTPGVPTVDAPRPERWTPDVHPRTLSKDQRLQHQEPRSPLVPTSLAAELDYAEASSILHSLPDLGSEYMARFDHITGMAERTIAAAELARSERSA